MNGAATHQWAQLSTLNDCCTVCGTVAHGDAPGAPGIVYPTGPCRGANAGSSDGAMTDLTVKTFGAMDIGHDGTHVSAAIFDRGDGTAAMATAAQAREWARALLAAADAVDPPVRDGVAVEIESPWTFAEVYPVGARAAVQVRDEQIATWAERHGFAAGREGDEQMTAYDLSTVDSNGLSNTALRDRAMYCEGQASAFRAVAAKLREAGR